MVKVEEEIKNILSNLITKYDKRQNPLKNKNKKLTSTILIYELIHIFKLSGAMG